MNYIYRMSRAFLNILFSNCLQMTPRLWCHSVKRTRSWKSCPKLWLYCILFILNSHKAFRLDNTLPSCQSRCHCKLDSLTTPDGGEINKGELFITLAGRSPHKLLFSFHPQRRGVHLRWRCRAPLPLPPSSSHKILLHYISENVTKFAIFFPKECAKTVSWRAFKTGTREIKIDGRTCLSDDKI